LLRGDPPNLHREGFPKYRQTREDMLKVDADDEGVGGDDAAGALSGGGEGAKCCPQEVERDVILNQTVIPGVNEAFFNQLRLHTIKSCLLGSMLPDGK